MSSSAGRQRATNGIRQGCPLLVILVNVPTPVWKREVDSFCLKACVAVVVPPPRPLLSCCEGHKHTFRSSSFPRCRGTCGGATGSRAVASMASKWDSGHERSMRTSSAIRSTWHVSGESLQNFGFFWNPSFTPTMGLGDDCVTTLSTLAPLMAHIMATRPM